MDSAVADVQRLPLSAERMVDLIAVRDYSTGEAMMINSFRLRLFGCSSDKDYHG